MRACVTAELPKLRGGALVLKDDVVKVEGIDFSGVEPAKALADVLQKDEELLFVVDGDRISCGLPASALGEAIRLGSAHIGTVPINLPSPRAAGYLSRSPDTVVTACPATCTRSRATRTRIVPPRKDSCRLMK
jgi:hypothetical protein